ncbi:MAG: hypothetical protein JSR58_00090 [Verrucomicrobia bacterium]|nr:hypothetical protein [Verrucomicrobiota bacterium]
MSFLSIQTQYNEINHVAALQIAEAKNVTNTYQKNGLKAQLKSLLQTLESGNTPSNLQDHLNDCKTIFESIKQPPSSGCFSWLDRIISYFTFEMPVEQLINKISKYVPAPKLIELKPCVVIVEEPIVPIDTRTEAQKCYDHYRNEIIHTKDSVLFADILEMPLPRRIHVEQAPESTFFQFVKNLASNNN